MMQSRFFVTSLIFLLITCQNIYAQSTSSEPKISPNDLNFQVSYDKIFENTIYPSLILGLANLSAKDNQSMDFLSYTMKAPANNCTIKIKLSQTKLNYESIFQIQLDSVGKEYSFEPLVSWNYDNLINLNQQGNVDMLFTCYVNGQEVDNKTLRLNYRSVNECVYGFIDEENDYTDLSMMFGAYINENHPLIDQFLKEVLNSKIVNSFTGYQDNSKTSVFLQVYAIWYTLQTKGIKYSSITDTSNSTDNIISQHVRFLDQVYNNTQANCVDGTVFLCSVLKKIGISPFIILIPGHMYMGYYTNEEETDVNLLETTMIGVYDFTQIYEDKNNVYNLNQCSDYLNKNYYDAYLKGNYTLEQLKKQISLSNFTAASNVNIEDYNSYIDKINDPENYAYKRFKVSDIRKAIQPISR